ncbi:MAG: YfbR-like 5'-deoxynucleotidase [Fervidobacterium sp.]
MSKLGKGKFLFSLTKLFTIQRWNNRPAVIRFSEADNSFNTLFLSFLFKTIFDGDIEESLRWRLARELPKIVLSDISLQLKERIERFSPKVWKELAEKSIEELKNSVDNEAIELLIFEKAEDPVDKLADLYISYLEAFENGKIFDYSQPLRELKEKIEILQAKFDKKQTEEFWDIANYAWSCILNLTAMVRWNRTHRNIRTTVSGHSFLVVTIAYLIAKLVDFQELKEVIVKSILHDFAEAFTGDVITPTKKKLPGFDELVSTVEREMIIEWIDGNKYLQPIRKYIEHFVNPFTGESGNIVRAADYFAALLECALEIYSGNKQDIFVDNFFTFKRLIKDISPLDVSEWIDEIESESRII